MFQPYLKLFLFISIIVVVINLKSVTAGAGRVGCFGGNGFYPAWTHWSQCSVTCGEGKRMRECRCFDDNDAATSDDGEGGCTTSTVNLQVVDKETCKLKDCPGDDDFEPFIIIIIVILILPLLKLFG